MACRDLHNGSGAENVLRGWGGLNFLLRRWRFDLRGSTSEVFPLRAFVVSPASAPFHSSCQFLLRFRGLNFLLSNTNSPSSVTRSPRLDFQPDSPKRASQHFHQHIFPLAPTFSQKISILGESWLLRSAVTTPISGLEKARSKLEQEIRPVSTSRGFNGVRLAVHGRGKDYSGPSGGGTRCVYIRWNNSSKSRIY